MPFNKNKSSVKEKEFLDGNVSPGWSVLAKPIPIGTSVSQSQEVALETTEEHSKENEEESCPSATYVTSHSDGNADVMDRIADEFQQAAETRRSKTNNEESITNDTGNTGNTISSRRDNFEHEMVEEETEVWTAGEEQSTMKDECALVLNEQSSSTITEQTGSPVREHTDSSNAISLNSDGVSNTEIQVRKNVEQRALEPDSCITNALRENINKGQLTAEQVQEPVASGSRNSADNTGSREAANNVRENNQPRVNFGNQSIVGRPPVGQNQNNRRWDFSMNGSQSARGEQPVGPIPEANGVQQKALLEIMSLGLGNFTNDMAAIVIEKLRPEYDVIAKRVGHAVKEETTAELTELREKVDAAENLLNHLEREKNRLLNELQKEKDQMRKEIDKERTKRMKENEEKNEKIDELERELKKAQTMSKEKERLSRRAESKAKTEEHRRVKVEETCDTKLKEMQQEVSRLKSEVLVQKSKNRVTSSNTRQMVKSGSLSRKLKSYHEHAKGKWPTVHPQNVPYDEGDP